MEPFGATLALAIVKCVAGESTRPLIRRIGAFQDAQVASLQLELRQLLDAPLRRARDYLEEAAAGTGEQERVRDLELARQALMEARSMWSTPPPQIDAGLALVYGILGDVKAASRWAVQAHAAQVREVGKLVEPTRRELNHPWKRITSPDALDPWLGRGTGRLTRRWSSLPPPFVGLAPAIRLAGGEFWALLDRARELEVQDTATSEHDASVERVGIQLHDLRIGDRDRRRWSTSPSRAARCLWWAAQSRDGQRLLALEEASDRVAEYRLMGLAFDPKLMIEKHRLTIDASVPPGPSGGGVVIDWTIVRDDTK